MTCHYQAKAPLSNLRYLLCALSFDLATAPWTACSSSVSQHNDIHDGLPPCPSLLIWESPFSSFLCRILFLIFTLSEPILLSTLQYRTLVCAMLSFLREGHISGRGCCFAAVYVCTGSCPHPLDQWAAERKVWGLETPVTLKFVSSWEMRGRTFCFVVNKVRGDVVNITQWLQKPV